MVEIIPAVLATNEEEYKAEFNVAKNVGNWIHIDIVDGKFAQNTTVSLDIIQKYTSDKSLEAHLMAYYPSEYIDRLLHIGFRRIILPAESREDLSDAIEKVKDGGSEVGISLNPETSIHSISEHFDDISFITLLGVHPGFGGQQLLSETQEKLEELVTLVPPGVKIEVDGGVTEKNAIELFESGADVVAMGSHLLTTEDPKSLVEKILGSL